MIPSSARGAAITASLALAGCAATAAPTTAPAPAASGSGEAPAPQTGAGWDGAWGRFHSKRHDAWLQLPDGATWKIDDHRSSWLVARHPATSTTLRFKLYREEHAVNRDRCLALARRDDPSLPEEGEAAIDRADALVPGWDSHGFAIVGGARGADAALTGQYLAWGASVRRCFVLHVSTTARGATAAAAVGARLADAADLARRLSFEEPTAGPGRVPRP